MVFTNKISKEKLLGGTAGVFSNWQRLGLYPKGRDEWEEERRPEKMMDGSQKARARTQLGRTWRWGVLCAAGPSPVPRLPIPSPHSTPMRRSSRHSRQNIFKEIGQKWKPPPHMVPC